MYSTVDNKNRIKKFDKERKTVSGSTGTEYRAFYSFITNIFGKCILQGSLLIVVLYLPGHLAMYPAEPAPCPRSALGSHSPAAATLIP